MQHPKCICPDSCGREGQRWKSNHHEDKRSLCEINPTYQDYTVTEGNQKVLYVHITCAIYGMLVSAMLFHCKLTKALLNYGFELNQYDLCGKQNAKQ